MNIFWGYIIFVNLLGFFIMRYDKQKSKKSAWRIPEKRLFLIGGVGGALGVFLAMKLYRHKTQHTSFTVGIPILILFNAVILYYLGGFIK